MAEIPEIPIEVCPKCAYDLRGSQLPDRCPECGQSADEKLIKRASKRRHTARWPTPTALAVCAALPFLSIVAALYTSPVDAPWDDLYSLSLLWIGALSGVASATLLTRSIADPRRRALVRNAWLPVFTQLACVPLAGLLFGASAVGLASLDDIPAVNDLDLAIVLGGSIIALIGSPMAIVIRTHVLLRNGGPTRAVALAEPAATRRLTVACRVLVVLNFLYGAVHALVRLVPVLSL